MRDHLDRQALSNGSGHVSHRLPVAAHAGLVHVQEASIERVSA